MNYTPIHSTYLQEIRDSTNEWLLKTNPSWRTSWFSQKKLGITPYKYQHLIWKHYHTDKRVITTKSRQIGISTAKQIFSLDCLENNLYPSGIHNNTKIGIISRDAKASTKMMREILELGRKQDSFNENNKFKEMLDFDAPNNMTQITLKNKCFAKCFAPTESIRGETFDIVLPDEGGFIDDEIFYNCIMPTVSKTNGKIFASSTPNGQKGWFFETFDPFDKFKVHEYTRFYFFWKQCEDPQMLKIIRQQREMAIMKGTYKNFQQEYEAKFTVDESAFFESTDVDKGIDHSLAMCYTWNLTPCSVGLDYGMAKSAMAITVKTKYKGNIVTLFQWASTDFDENLLMDEAFDNSLPNLRKRYPVTWVVADDCTQGYRTNLELENKGYPLKRYDWGRGISRGTMENKNRYYYDYRAALRKGLIKYPEIREMIVEMKQLMEVRMKIISSIEKPKGGMDDRIDSEVMASIPFLEEEGNFESILIEAQPTTIKEQFKNPYRDAQWDDLKSSSVDAASYVYEHNRKILGG